MFNNHFLLIFIINLMFKLESSTAIAPKPVATVANQNRRQLSPQVINFLAGGIAGSIASTITTPVPLV